ncbi:PLP-dependent cysteine synthase family protein [Streptomyces sp. NPDC026673]|uniref:PLP-dependent cysteine synthase family protein n=1 Tax=Streptomyces sp. NPDC026673 TaxID=3155724 RepID=UPI00340389D4
MNDPTIGRDLASAVGNTPLLRISHPVTAPDRGFWAKLEGANPGGIKDRPALHMVGRARERGDLLSGATIVASTSGAFGLGLLLAAQVFGHPVTLVTDPDVERDTKRLLRARGARLDVVRDAHPHEGWQEARRRRVAELLAAEPGAWCPDPYDNPDAADAYTPLAAELVGQLGRIDVLVTCVGTGGHSAGVSRALRAGNPDLHVIGVDAVGSSTFGQPVRPRLMTGLGSSVHSRNVAYDQFAEVHWVAPGEAVHTCRALARSHYASGGWSVGAVALVAGWAARTHPADARVVAVFPDGPHRYLSTVYDDDYCRDHGLLGVVPAAEPAEIGSPTEAEVVRWTRCRKVTAPLTARIAPPAVPVDASEVV